MYENATDFYILILGLETSLNFQFQKVFWWELLEFSVILFENIIFSICNFLYYTCNTYSIFLYVILFANFANRDSFTCCFSIGCLLIFFLVCYFIWVKLAVLCWIEVVGVDILVFVLLLILEENLSIFHLLVVTFTLYYVEIHSFTHFVESFLNHKWCWIPFSFVSLIHLPLN